MYSCRIIYFRKNCAHVFIMNGLKIVDYIGLFYNRFDYLKNKRDLMFCLNLKIFFKYFLGSGYFFCEFQRNLKQNVSLPFSIDSSSVTSIFLDYSLLLFRTLTLRRILLNFWFSHLSLKI